CSTNAPQNEIVLAKTEMLTFRARLLLEGVVQCAKSGQHQTSPANKKPGQLVLTGWKESEDPNASGFREVQLDADAIRIIKEELRVPGAWHDAFAELDVLLRQPLAHALDVGRGKGDMVETTSVVEFLLGAAHHDALTRLTGAHQMHGGLAARIEPV